MPNWRTINAGVPQGSVLGPILFLIYVNDLVDNVTSYISLFTDDTSLYRTVHSHLDVGILNNDLSCISDWGKQWLVNFNPCKTKYVVFSRRKRARVNYEIVFENVGLLRETSHKHLGIWFSDDLTWGRHVEHIFNKCSKRLNILKSIQVRAPRACLESIYEHMILPIIEYANVIYDNMPLHLSNKLESFQRQAALACTGGYKLTSYNALLVELGWSPLLVRRKCHRLIVLFKITNKIAPPYLHDIVGPSQVSYNLRHSDRLRAPFFGKKFCFNSFVPKTIRDWNELPVDIIQSPSLNIFKSRIKNKFYNEKNYIFKWGTGAGSIQLSRMRMGLSGLNFHRFLYNFIDSPVCLHCFSPVEDVAHFLNVCPHFAAHRQKLVTQLALLIPSYTEHVIHKLLFGTSELNLQDNIRMLKIIQEYITLTKRFL